MVTVGGRSILSRLRRLNVTHLEPLTAIEFFFILVVEPLEIRFPPGVGIPSFA